MCSCVCVCVCVGVLCLECVCVCVFVCIGVLCLECVVVCVCVCLCGRVSRSFDGRGVLSITVPCLWKKWRHCPAATACVCVCVCVCVCLLPTSLLANAPSHFDLSIPLSYVFVFG